MKRRGTLAKDGVKRCSKCQVEKPIGQFYGTKDGRYKDEIHPWCKACQAARARAYIKTPRGREVRRRALAKFQASGKYAACKARWYVRKGHRSHREDGWKRNGIIDFSYNDYERLFATQRGRCAICQMALSMIHGGENPTAQVDHDRKTGRARGLLCAGCNHGIGSLKDDPGLLEAAASYLRR